MGEHNVVYSYLGILFSHKKKEVLTCYSIRKALCLVKKNPDAEGQILNCATYTKSLGQANSETERRLEFTGVGWSGDGKLLVNESKVSVCGG